MTTQDGTKSTMPGATRAAARIAGAAASACAEAASAYAASGLLRKPAS